MSLVIKRDGELTSVSSLFVVRRKIGGIHRSVVQYRRYIRIIAGETEKTAEVVKKVAEFPGDYPCNKKDSQPVI